MVDPDNRPTKIPGEAGAATCIEAAATSGVGTSCRSVEARGSEHPFRSWREFTRHISVVALGVMVALALEGLLEWRNHRALAREARENILAEIAANLRSVRSVLASREKIGEEDREILAFVDDRGGGRPRPEGMSFAVVSISGAGWNSAQVTGAVTHMPFEEVQQFAALYDIQQHFLLAQQQTLRDSALMGAAPNIENASAEEFSAWRGRIRTRQVSFQLEAQIAQSLAGLYESILTEHGRPVEGGAGVASATQAP